MDVQLLPDQLPWYVAGPLMGLCVAGLFAIANLRLGVSGAFGSVAMVLRRQAGAEMWRVWFFVGLFGGALLAALLRGGVSLSLEYGSLGRVMPLAALVPLLFIGGVLMGYGARWAGGCTSGHGLTGTSTRSPASLTATLTFMGTAILVTIALNVLSGGVL